MSGPRWFVAVTLAAVVALATPRAQAPGPTRILIVFDLSYSMREPLTSVSTVAARRGALSRIAAARIVFKDALTDLPPATEIGLRLLGHVGNKTDEAACRETALMTSIASGSRERITATVLESTPVGRKTPLAFALEQAKADIAAVRGPKKVLLLSDGLDTCKGDPSRAAAELRASGVQVDAIALGMDGVADLGRIALAGGGRFSLATNVDALRAALRQGLSGQAAPSSGGRGTSVAGSAARAEGGLSMHVEIVLDSSGSMAGQQGGRTKIAIAKDALQEAVKELTGSEIALAFRAYGFDSKVPKEKAASCRNTELLVGFGSGGPQAIVEKARSLGAYGYTPIAASLRLAGEDLRPHKDSRPTILLISDGEETCDGDPVAEIRKLRATGIAVQVHVIGFDLDPKARAQMMAVARAGRGHYVDARDPQALVSALKARATAMRAEAAAIKPRPTAPVPRPYPTTPGAPVPTVLEAYFTEMHRAFPPTDERPGPSNVLGAGSRFWKLGARDTRIPSQRGALLFLQYRPAAWKIASVDESGDFALAQVDFTVGSPLQLRGQKAPVVRRAEYALVRDEGNWYLTGFQDLERRTQVR